ncbi:hypothetical protein [Burkholderia gladioli]|uniref:hypothetical protein n=1 Tax=Burkholderia gladioli TaxID=28095 RepID=UPI00163EF53F|nr:hypothetical protein [Burkholderia gladioli]
MLGDTADIPKAESKKSNAAAQAAPASASPPSTPVQPAVVPDLAVKTPPAGDGDLHIDEEADAGEDSIPVRVLTKCEHGNPNDVVELSRRDARIAKDAGTVCDHPASVAFARSLRR